MWQLWTLVVLGIWLIVSPFILGYSNVANALWNNIVIGIAVAVIAYWGTIGKKQA